MGVAETTIIITVAFFMIFFFFILLLRWARYGTMLGSLAATMQGGIPIIDKSGTGEIAEMTGWEKNPQTGKIRLALNYVDSFRQMQTGFIFEESDFQPNPSKIDWRHFMGTIILHKDFEGSNDFRDNVTLMLTEQAKTMKHRLSIYKRSTFDLLAWLEKEKSVEAKVNDNIAAAKALKTLKSITEETNVEPFGEPSGSSSMFDD